MATEDTPEKGATGKVEATTSDHFMRHYDLKHIDLLKCDIEGEEIEVFKHPGN